MYSPGWIHILQLTTFLTTFLHASPPLLSLCFAQVLRMCMCSRFFHLCPIQKPELLALPYSLAPTVPPLSLLWNFLGQERVKQVFCLGPQIQWSIILPLSIFLLERMYIVRNETTLENIWKPVVTIFWPSYVNPSKINWVLKISSQ